MRARGEGTVFQRANGTWTAQVTTPAGRRSHTFTTQRKAMAWLTQQRHDLNMGTYVEPSDMPLSTWWDKWVRVYKVGQVGKATLESYRYSRARLPQTLLETQIGKLTRADIQGALNGLTASRRTVEVTRSALRMCLQRAVDDQLIRRNPTDGAALPAKVHTHKAKAMTPEDEAALLTMLTKPLNSHHWVEVGTQTVRDALLLILRTGLRRSECVRLTWGDIKGCGVRVKGTKTAGSTRTVPIAWDDALAMLERRRLIGSMFIFATNTGRPVSGSSLLRWMEAHTAYTVHDLRHTYATRARQAGVNVEVLQRLLGHTNISTTLGIYTHVTDEEIEAGAAKIAANCIRSASDSTK